jgi:cytochrome c556
MNKVTKLLAAALTGGILLGAYGVRAAEQPKYTTKEVMKALYKGKESLHHKVADGNGTPEDFGKLVEYLPSLQLNDPPVGDKKEWQDRCKKLVAAAKDLKAGKPGALDGYKAAANCKECHTAHKKPDEKH